MKEFFHHDLKTLPLKASLAYLLLAVLWIVATDRMLLAGKGLFGVEILTLFQTYKGLFFVVSTSILIWIFVRNNIESIQRSQNALRKSEQRHRALAENAMVGIYEMTLGGTLIYMNPAMCRLFEVSSVEEFTLRPFHSYFEGDGGGILQALMEGREGPGINHETVIISAKGTRRNVWISGSLLSSEDGEDTELIGAVIDITERKQAELALLRSEEHFRTVVENIGESVSIIDSSGVIIYESPATERIFGYTPEDLVGRHAFNQIAPEDLDKAGKIFQNLFRRPGVTESVVFTMRHKDGSWRKAESVAKVIRFSSGDMFAFVSTRDITERTLIEEKVRQNELLLKSVNTNIREGIYRSTPGRGLIYANKAFAEIFGYASVEEVLSVSLPSLYNDPAQRDAFLAEVEEKGSCCKEVLFVRRNGTIFWGMITTTITHDQQGDKYYDGAITDITARKEAEEALSRANEELEHRVLERTADLENALHKLNDALAKEKELNELKTRFVSMVSHEFRTPLTSILSSAEILDCHREKLDDTNRSRLHSRIVESVRHMNALLEDVLVLGKAASNQLQFQPKAINPRIICRDLLEESHSGIARDRAIEFSVQGHDREAMLDPKLLRYIMLNLLSNALKYSPKEEKVYLDLEFQDKSIFFKVRDKGIGMGEDELKNLFEPFYRSKSVETIPGTGLGLSIVKQSIERHGGTITIHSRPGEGTTFIVEIPAVYAKAEEPLFSWDF